MTLPSLVLGTPQWLLPAAALLAVAAVAVVWIYARARAARPAVTAACAALKAVGFTALGLCLLDPLLTGTRPKPGANVFAVLADNSQSLQVRDGDSGRSRADWSRNLLAQQSPWKTRLGQDFDLREYAFDANLRTVDGTAALTYDGTASSLHAALNGLAKRFQGRPLAGVLLVSDGNATDPPDGVDWSKLPPIYPVIPPTGTAVKDIAIARVTLNQTNFEAAPVVLQAEVTALGFAGQPVVAVVSDGAGKPVERQEAKPTADRDTLNFRFQLRPDKSGVGFYRVQVRSAAEFGDADDAPTVEQTLANNARLAVVDRGGGPYRVLYVGGRPNWEFKFLRRAVEEDAEVQLVGLIRVARRQPKFDFRDQQARNNQLFKGFDNADPDTAERHDQPVLIRLGTADAEELRAGFPQTAADLYRYHAVVLDDVEAGFFTQDQLALLRNFVSRRGGGFLMLGGPDSFAAGKYDRTPVGDLLPVYLDRSPEVAADAEYRLVLTREGWLQPWVRTRKTEDDEGRRLASMPPFLTVNAAGGLKPGAAALAQVRDDAGRTLPALAVQPFGKGRSAALLVGDFWRWGIRRDNPRHDDFDRSWRQTVRWLVGDVPGRVEVQVRPAAGSASRAVELAVRAADAEYLPLDNATVTVTVTRTDKGEVAVAAEPDGREAGLYVARFVPKEPGAYRAVAAVTAPDGTPVGTRDAGWCNQPSADEFAHPEPNRAALEAIASRTGGEVVAGDDLESFVAGLPARGAPVTETWAVPLWHHGLYFLLAVACLAAEWGLRRTNGLA